MVTSNARRAACIELTKTGAQANPDDYDALLVPGGFIDPDLLRESEEARKFVRAFDRDKKPIASPCHGPWVLASAGLLKRENGDLVNAGATWLDQEFVRDANL